MKFVSIFTLPPDAVCPPDEKSMAAMGQLMGEMMASGKLIDTGGTNPTGVSMRVKHTGNGFTVTDGPFAESKEIVGGFAVMDFADKAEAIVFTKRFLECAGSGTCQLHEVSETPGPHE